MKKYEVCYRVEDACEGNRRWETFEECDTYEEAVEAYERMRNDGFMVGNCDYDDTIIDNAVYENDEDGSQTYLFGDFI